MDEQIGRVARILREMNVPEASFMFTHCFGGWDLIKVRPDVCADDLARRVMADIYNIMNAVERSGSRNVILKIGCEETFGITPAPEEDLFESGFEDDDMVIQDSVIVAQDPRAIASTIGKASPDHLACAMVLDDTDDFLWRGILMRSEDLIVCAEITVCGAELKGVRISYGTVRSKVLESDIAAITAAVSDRKLSDMAIEGLLKREVEVMESSVSMIPPRNSTVSHAPSLIMDKITFIPFPESHAHLMAKVAEVAGILMVFIDDDSKIIRAAVSK